MSNDLTKNGSNAPGVTEGDDIEQRLLQMRQAAVLNEERVIRYGCAATGGTYLVRYRRKAADERFSVAAVEKVAASDKGSGLFGGLFKKAAPQAQPYSWDEFDTDDLLCPYCGNDGGSTHCGDCDRQMCGSGRRTMPGGKRKYFCHESCGASFYTETAKEVRADRGGNSGAASKLPAPAAKQALASPALRLGGPREQ